jgi:hypothetical protein
LMQSPRRKAVECKAKSHSALDAESKKKSS